MDSSTEHPIANDTQAAEAGAPAAPKARRARVDWSTYNPSQSTAIFEQELELGANITQRSFGEWYSRVVTASLMLNDVMPRLMKKPAAAQTVLDSLNEIYEKAHEDLTDDLLPLRQQLRESGIVAARKFSKPRALTVPFYNNHCRLFLQLVAMFDEIVWHLDCLCAYGSIKNSERIKKQSQARKAVSQVSLDTSRMWARARDGLKRAANEEGSDDAAGIDLAEQKAAALTKDLVESVEGALDAKAMEADREHSAESSAAHA